MLGIIGPVLHLISLPPLPLTITIMLTGTLAKITMHVAITITASTIFPFLRAYGIFIRSIVRRPSPAVSMFAFSQHSTVLLIFVC